MRVLFGPILVALASLCGAHVEKQFKLPDFLRQPFYDVDITYEPFLDLEGVSADRIVSINHIGRPLKCLLPDASTNATLKPLTDQTAISQARSILQNYKNITHLHLDDVWGWNFKFDENIVQFFPEESPEPGVFHLSSSSFQVYIGKTDDAPGLVSLDDAKPVVVDDQHMLYTHFVNGTQCDLTLEPRVANVFFACSPDSKAGTPTILSIDEPYSCTYEFVVGIHELCSIKGFQAEIPVNTIRCGIDPDEVLEDPHEDELGSDYHYVQVDSEKFDDLERELYQPKNTEAESNGNNNEDNNENGNGNGNKNEDLILKANTNPISNTYQDDPEGVLESHTELQGSEGYTVGTEYTTEDPDSEDSHLAQTELGVHEEL